MTEITDSFLGAPRKHRGAKPKLPVTQTAPRWNIGHGYVALLDAEGRYIAADVPLRDADYVATAINMHDELVEALEEVLDQLERSRYAPAHPCLSMARAALAAAKATKGTEP